MTLRGVRAGRLGGLDTSHHADGLEAVGRVKAEFLPDFDGLLSFTGDEVRQVVEGLEAFQLNSVRRSLARAAGRARGQGATRDDFGSEACGDR